MSGRAVRAPAWRRGADVAARTVAAIGLGYLLAALAAAALARWLPVPRLEATMTGSLISFAVFAAVAMWAFAAREAWRVWAYGCLVASGLAVLIWLSLLMEPRL
ncbi:hypothetical protein [Phenylobacterium sp.]|uniref:hypothetical protein n=1 Tax=Phenylobacterium sp. TaxID=1871053 RepID=UPI0027307723|nr:hypothetical protein [Phenylobacterium sp.]MDP1617954.1 hypothetical protein [Phenylobacterium sp.]MDP1985836.1 hypothetical protein [Phenylobacterium sp.]